MGGRFGHLANAASADILRAVMHPGLRCVVAAHLSARNNAPELAQQALADAVGWDAAQILVASPSSGTDWHDVT
ncbi:hypothetical protein D3C86_1733900 [compost metagenome]